MPKHPESVESQDDENGPETPFHRGHRVDFVSFLLDLHASSSTKDAFMATGRDEICDEDCRRATGRDFTPYRFFLVAVYHIKKLLKFRECTDPCTKDIDAVKALRTAGEMVRDMTGWAQAHMFGRVLEDSNSVSPQSSQTAEQRGSALLNPIMNNDWEKIKPTPAQIRQMLIDFLRANSGGAPDWLVHDCVQDLEASKVGQRALMFDPIEPKSNLKRPAYTQLKLRMYGCEYVAFHTERGMKSEVAEAQVAEAYICNYDGDYDVVRKWKGRLVKQYGLPQVNDRLARARDCAVKEKAARERGDPNAIHYGAEYSREKLIEAGRKYKNRTP